MARTVKAIAFDIQADMARMSPGSNTRIWTAPYLHAMSTLDSINDQYIEDDGRTIVRYFLANADGWRGENARRLKAELRAMLAEPRRS